MRVTLTGAGYEVDDARTGEEALGRSVSFDRTWCSSISTCPEWAD
jgi:hypothetical protein